MAIDPAPTYICVVCSERVEAGMSAECNWCDGRYHLNQRNDVEAQDCGRVWIDEQYLALMFACDSCLAKDDVTAPAPAPLAPGRRAAHDTPSTPRVRRYKRRA